MKCLDARGLFQRNTLGMEEMMATEDVPYRGPTRDSIDYFDVLLQIDKNSYGQDWEIEISDPNRLVEFPEVYKNKSRNEEDRCTLMTLIVSSFEDSMVDETNEEMWNTIRRHLLTEFQLHQYTIHYWCCAEETDAKNVFRVTPLMRSVWNEGIRLLT